MGTSSEQKLLWSSSWTSRYREYCTYNRFEGRRTLLLWGSGGVSGGFFCFWCFGFFFASHDDDVRSVPVVGGADFVDCANGGSQRNAIDPHSYARSKLRPQLFYAWHHTLVLSDFPTTSTPWLRADCGFLSLLPAHVPEVTVFDGEDGPLSSAISAAGVAETTTFDTVTTTVMAT